MRHWEDSLGPAPEGAREEEASAGSATSGLEESTLTLLFLPAPTLEPPAEWPALFWVPFGLPEVPEDIASN